MKKGTSKPSLSKPNFPQFEGVTIKQEFFDEDDQCMGVKVKNEPVSEGECHTTPDFHVGMNVKTEPCDEIIDISDHEEEEEIITPDYQNKVVPTSVKPISLPCPLCRRGTNPINLANHLQVRHPETMINPDQLLLCRLCKCKFQSKYLLPHSRSHYITDTRPKRKAKPHTAIKEEHLRIKNMESSNKLKVLQNSCPICVDDTRTKINDLRIHLAVFHQEQLTDPKQSHTCVLCNNPFCTKDIYTHTSSSVCTSRRVCYHCFKPFNKWNELRLHLQRIHKVFCCNLCDVICGREPKLLKHIHSNLHFTLSASRGIWQKEKINEIFKDKQVKPHDTCPLCPIGTKVSHLQFHLRLVHGDVLKNLDKLKQCVICKEYVKSKDILDHASNCTGKEGMEKEYLRFEWCEYCQNIFVDTNEYNVHMVAHYHSKSYKDLVLVEIKDK